MCLHLARYCHTLEIPTALAVVSVDVVNNFPRFKATIEMSSHYKAVFQDSIVSGTPMCHSEKLMTGSNAYTNTALGSRFPCLVPAVIFCTVVGRRSHTRLATSPSGITLYPSLVTALGTGFPDMDSPAHSPDRLSCRQVPDIGLHLVRPYF